MDARIPSPVNRDTNRMLSAGCAGDASPGPSPNHRRCKGSARIDLKGVFRLRFHDALMRPATCGTNISLRNSPAPAAPSSPYPDHPHARDK